MTAKWILAITAIGCATLAAAPAGAATTSQFRAKCANAWTGGKDTAAYRSFRTRCTTAARAATSDATDAGNPTSVISNTKRAKAACTIQFPLPRRSAAKKKAYNTCVTAANRAQRSYGLKALRATLLGANEVPAAHSATGTASVRVNVAQRRLCVTLTLKGETGAILAHIHSGRAGQNGPPVVDLTTAQLLDSLNRGRAGKLCVNGIGTALLRDLRRHPGNYYVNIHTTQHAAGAARGQLHR